MKLQKEQYRDHMAYGNLILYIRMLYGCKLNELDDFIQIINVYKLHWVGVSNKNCSPHTIDVFDSIGGLSLNSTSLKNQIAAILKTPTSSFNINFIDVQTQMGSNDCSIFVIAFAVALCSVRDPHMESYEQNEMRNHLHQCFSAGKLDNFPPSPSRQRRVMRNCFPACKKKVYCA